MRSVAIKLSVLSLMINAICVALMMGKADDRYLMVWHAEWCGPCQKMEPHVKKLQKEGEPVLWLDYDELPESAAKWGVEKLPTSILVVDGEEADRQVGYRNYGQLKGMLNQ
jgi:thioredoxin 1